MENTQSVIVMKFGGTSLGSAERVLVATKKVVAEYKKGLRPVVVVSAMAGETDRLVSLCQSVGYKDVDDALKAEYDAVLSSGEQVSAGLFAIALSQHGIQARSWTGWQAGVKSSGAHSKARITGIDTDQIMSAIAQNEIPVLTGFQAITATGRIATLGRGGSDTSAVAVAAALKALRCDIYTDVDGVYSTDPRIVPKASRLKQISYSEMLEMASLGSKVLHVRSVEMAMKYAVQLQVLSSLGDDIGSDYPGTLIVSDDYAQEKKMEDQLITGITLSQNEAKITIFDLPDVPGIAADIFGVLDSEEIAVDMIVQNVSADGKKTDMTFTLARAEAKSAINALKAHQSLSSYEIACHENVSKLSIVGIGMRSHTLAAKKMFSVLAENKINIDVIVTSEIKISVLIDEARSHDAVKSLHTAFGLDS